MEIIRPHPDLQIGIWKIAETEAELLQMYNPDEAEAGLLQNMPEARRRHYLGSRLLARGFAPGALITKDENGKPGFGHGNPQMSWSHSGDFAVIACNAKESTGIDIELVRDRILRVMGKFCNQADLQCIQEHHKTESLMVIWAAKESMYKWYGKKEVDFRKHMTCEPFTIGAEGRFHASLHLPTLHRKFDMEYRIFEGYVLVWIVQENPSSETAATTV